MLAPRLRGRKEVASDAPIVEDRFGALKEEFSVMDEDSMEVDSKWTGEHIIENLCNAMTPKGTQHAGPYYVFEYKK